MFFKKTEYLASTYKSDGFNYKLTKITIYKIVYFILKLTT